MSLGKTLKLLPLYQSIKIENKNLENFSNINMIGNEVHYIFHSFVIKLYPFLILMIT